MVVGYVVKQCLAFNWAGLSTNSELALFCALFVITNTALVLIAGAGHRRADVIESLGLLSTMIFGGGIWLVMRTCYLQDPSPGILVWGLTTLVMAWVLQSAPQALLALAILAQWSFGETSHYQQITWALFLSACSIGFIFFRKESLALVGLVPCVFGLNGTLQLNTIFALTWLGLGLPAFASICQNILPYSRRLISGLRSAALLTALRRFAIAVYGARSRIVGYVVGLLVIMLFFGPSLVRKILVSPEDLQPFLFPSYLSLICMLAGWLGRGFGYGRDEDWRSFLLYSTTLVAGGPILVFFLASSSEAMFLVGALLVLLTLCIVPGWQSQSLAHYKKEDLRRSLASSLPLVLGVLALERCLGLPSRGMLLGVWIIVLQATRLKRARPLWLMLNFLFAFRYCWLGPGNSSAAPIYIGLPLLGLFAARTRDWPLFIGTLPFIWLTGSCHYEITDLWKAQAFVVYAISAVLWIWDTTTRPQSERLIPMLAASVLTLWSLPSNHLNNQEFLSHPGSSLITEGATYLLISGVMLGLIGFLSVSNTRLPTRVNRRKRLVCALLLMQLVVLGLTLGCWKWNTQSGHQIRINVELGRNYVLRGVRYSTLKTHLTEVPIEMCREGLLAALKSGASRYDGAVYAVLSYSADSSVVLESLSDRRPTQGVFLRGHIESVESDSVIVRYGFEDLLLNLPRRESWHTSPLEIVAAVQTDGSALVRGVERAPLSMYADYTCHEKRQIITGTRIRNHSDHNVEIHPADIATSLKVLIKKNSYLWGLPKATVRFNLPETRDHVVSPPTVVLRPGDTWDFKINLADPAWTIDQLGRNDPACEQILSAARKSGTIPAKELNLWEMQLEYSLRYRFIDSGSISPIITQSLRSQTVSLIDCRCGHLCGFD